MTATKLAKQPLFNAEDPLNDMAFITTYTGMADKRFYKQTGDRLFTKPVKPGRSSRRRRSEMEIWMQQRTADSRGA